MQKGYLLCGELLNLGAFGEVDRGTSARPDPNCGGSHFLGVVEALLSWDRTALEGCLEVSQ